MATLVIVQGWTCERLSWYSLLKPSEKRHWSFCDCRRIMWAGSHRWPHFPEPAWEWSQEWSLGQPNAFSYTISSPPQPSPQPHSGQHESSSITYNSKIPDSEGLSMSGLAQSGNSQPLVKNLNEWKVNSVHSSFSYLGNTRALMIFILSIHKLKDREDG